MLSPSLTRCSLLGILSDAWSAWLVIDHQMVIITIFYRRLVRYPDTDWTFCLLQTNSIFSSQKQIANALVVNPVSSPFQVVRAECVFLTSTALWRLLSEDSCLSSAIFWLEIETNRSLFHFVFIATKVWADDPNMVSDIDWLLSKESFLLQFGC